MKLFSFRKPAAAATCLIGPRGAQQQLGGAGAAHLVFQALQRGAFVLELAVQRARRNGQQRGQRLGAVRLQRMCGQRLAHALHQQAVAPVLQHRQRQGALQHLRHRGFVAAQRQCQVTCVEAQLGPPGAKGHCRRKQDREDRGIGRRRKRKARLLQRDARVHKPAGQAVDVAQHVDQGEFARGTQVGVLVDHDRGLRAGAHHAQPDVAGQQAMVAAPAFERHAQIRRAERGARQHAVAAPGQAPRKGAQAFVVEFLHRRAGQQLHLAGGHAAVGLQELGWRDLCQLQRL